MLEIHRDTMGELNPTGINKEANLQEVTERRTRQKQGARIYLTSGDEKDQSYGPPPYGKVWNREYNPRPYPESVPDKEIYGGTGVGFLYGFYGRLAEFDIFPHAWHLAGWTLVRTGAEVRSKKR